MASAHIIFQQNSDGYSTSCSRDDLVLSLPVTMLNQDDTGVVSWAWNMIDKPTGSSAVIISPTASTTTFTPDIVGTYLIHLSVNAGASQEQKGAAIKTANFQYRLPAATETIEFDGYRGWATATNNALQLIDDGYIPPPIFQSVYDTSIPSSFIINTSNGSFKIHDASTPTGINLFEIDAYGAGSKFFTVAVAATTVNNKLLVTGTNFVGVNTSSPLYPVHVTTPADNYSFIQTRSTIVGGLYARTASTAGLGLGTFSNHALLFFTNNTPGTPSMILTTGGSVGIGTVSPSSKLDVTGTGHFTGSVSFDSGFVSGAASSMGGFKLTSLATPDVGTDATNKTYVDTAISSVIVGGIGIPGQKFIISVPTGDRATNNSSTPKVVSAFAFDPTAYTLTGTTRTLIWRAVVASGTGLTVHCKLYNFTDSEYVTGADLTTSVTTLTKLSAALTAGNAAGQVKLSEKVYQVELTVIAPVNPDDTIELYGARLDVFNTIN